MCRALVNYWIENKYTLRYSGGLVPDVYHILIKGQVSATLIIEWFFDLFLIDSLLQGVLANASSESAKAKLRLLFECAPIALVRINNPLPVVGPALY
jgi:sedoheptulose-bisphosphatase